MGINFYWIIDEEMNPIVSDDDGDSQEIHIGKRSCAGNYCYDCGIFLTYDHTKDAHNGKGRNCLRCPRCNSEGKNACTFTWTMMYHLKRLQKLAVDYPDLNVVRDEYGGLNTASEFLNDILASCPIQPQFWARFS